MPRRDVVVIGASAGGVEALTTVVGRLPERLPAAVFVVLHVPSHGRSLLARVLGRHANLAVAGACDGDPVTPGRISVAPTDHHLMLSDGRVRVVRWPRENGHRPAIDVLFRSAASSYGPRVVGVLLSGLLDDGTSGLAAIKQRGGLAVVQDPADAMFPDMPRSALRNVDLDHVLPLDAIGPALGRLVDEGGDAHADAAWQARGGDALRPRGAIGPLPLDGRRVRGGRSAAVRPDGRPGRRG